MENKESRPVFFENLQNITVSRKRDIGEVKNMPKALIQSLKKYVNSKIRLARNLSSNRPEGRSPYNTNGFSWLELIVVLMIMGVVSAVIVSTMTTSRNEITAEIEALKAHLRYAQSRAMSTASNWYVQFDATPTPGQYTLYKAGEGANYFPGESAVALPLHSGMTLNGTPIVFFDRLGRPYTDSAGTSLQSGPRTLITSSVGDIEIKPETGFVP